MKKVFLSLITIFIVLSLSIVLVKANTNTKTSVVIEEGVQIRTDGNNGLKWVANVSYHKDSNVYGFLFGQGDLAEVNINTANVVNQVVEGVTAENPVMSATMTKFPKSAVAQDISVVAYVKDGENYTYSNVVVRNLAEVAVAAKAKEETGDFIDEVVKFVGNNYKKVDQDVYGNIYIDSAIYETNHNALGKAFIADWNEVMETTLDASTAFVTNFYDSPFKKSAGNSSKVEASGNLVTFFNHEKMKAKWGWILDYILEELKDGIGYSPCKYQIGLIRGTTENDGSENWYYGYTLVSYLQSIFNAKGTSAGSGQFKFETSSANMAKLAKIVDYNKTIYASSIEDLVKVGEEYSLSSLAPATGYKWDGWTDGTSSYSSKYAVTATNTVLNPSYSPISYTITYMDGNTVLTQLSSNYTIESSTITLPNYSKSGFSFEGWFDNAEFEGNKITSITAGSTGNKIFYAKTVESSNVAVSVTYDLNGGYYSDRDIDTTDFIGGAYNSIDWSAYKNYISLGTKTRIYWYYVALNKTELDDIYKVAVGKTYIEENTNLGHDLYILFCGDHKTSIPDLYTLCEGLKVGQLVSITNIPTSNTTSATINVKVYGTDITLDDFGTDISVQYTLETDLITPVREGYKFMGWKSSVDGSVITKYPGYTTNPGNITYTAQWKSDNEININIDLNGGYWANENIVKSNLEGDAVSTTSIVRYTGNYYGYYEEGTLIGDIGIMDKSSSMRYAYRIGLKKVDGVYQIVQLLYDSKIEFNSDVEYVIHGQNELLKTFYGECHIGDIIIFNKDISNLTASQVNITVNLYSNAQYQAAKQKKYSETVNAQYQINYEVKHSSLKFVGWYDNPEGTGEKLTTITKSCTVYAVWSSSIVVSYDTDPFTEVGGTIQLNAQIIGTLVGNFVWESKNTNIATVDQTGKVTGVKEGTATIYVYDSSDPSVNLTIQISIVSEGLSELFSIISNAHNDSIFKKLDLRIGTSSSGYNADIYGSVSKILFNKPLYIDEKYLANGIATGNYYENSVKDTGLEFITVHYTAGFPASSDTDNNASYFTTASAGVSIHYVTGNNGTYSDGTQSSSVYKCMSHDHGAWHAGDSNARYHSNSNKTNSLGQLIFSWMPTGVTYDGADLMDIEWSASDDFYFEINGKKTSIKLPSTWNYKYNGTYRNTNHIYNSNGTISAQSGYSAWGTTFSNRTPESFFNDQGFPVKVIDGEYYMGPTWWSYGQVYEGRICGSGGNLNSIGIESCVNEGSDLWLTWQTTAQLVAKLCYDNGLGFERIKGHHFFDGKDCPQPLLANDMEIWDEFIELVKYEYELLTKFSNYTISFVSNNTEFVSNTGRVIKIPAKDTTVSYTVTLTDKTTGNSNSVTYFTTIPGME